MILIVFHRETQDVYAPPCDVASVAVVDIATQQPAGYVGAAWAEAAEPPPEQVLNYAVLDDPSMTDAVLAQWGVQIPQPPPFPGAYGA